MSTFEHIFCQSLSMISRKIITIYFNKQWGMLVDCFLELIPLHKGTSAYQSTIIEKVHVHFNYCKAIQCNFRCPYTGEITSEQHLSQDDRESRYSLKLNEKQEYKQYCSNKQKKPKDTGSARIQGFNKTVCLFLKQGLL